MNFPAAAVNGAGDPALAASVAIYSALIGFAIREHTERRGGTLLLVTSFCGVVLYMAASASGNLLLRHAALALFVLVVIEVLGPVLAQGIRRKQWRWPEIGWLWKRPKFLLLGVGFTLVAAGGVALGALVLGGGSTTTTTLPPPSGRYRIAGTCANGSCYVNECVTAATCGSGPDNGGKLKEETAIDIVCQAKGKPARAPNGHHSMIWDRLSTHLYVSDLYVAGTRYGHFTPNLQRCSESH